MTIEPQTFKYSQDTINLSKRNLLFMQIYLPILMGILIFFVFGQDIDLQFKVIFFTGFTLFFELMILGIWFIVGRSIQQITLDLYDGFLERQAQRNITKIEYAEIRHIRIHQNRSEQVIGIEIKSSNNQMNLFGFDKTQTILAYILERIPASTPIQTKQNRIDWFNPYLMIAFVLMLNGLLIGIYSFGEFIWRIIFFSFLILNGIFHLVYKPISKSMGYKKIEIVAGVFYIASGLGLLWLLFR